MNNYILLIQYDGGRYKGWQRLADDENTIQGKIENVLSQMTGDRVEINGSSRTDAGVHAIAQIASFKTDKSFPARDIMKYLNRYLPNDISILEVSEAPESFHARYSAGRKTYLYKLWNREYPEPFLRKYSMHVEERLDIEGMRKAARYFIGEHDFTAFSNAKSKKKSMVREIYSIDITEQEGLIEIRVCGNGFLYNMVRRIVGTLVAVGLGEVNAVRIPEILNSGERSQAGHIADACGLFLEKIEFQ